MHDSYTSLYQPAEFSPERKVDHSVISRGSPNWAIIVMVGVSGLPHKCLGYRKGRAQRRKGTLTCTYILYTLYVFMDCFSFDEVHLTNLPFYSSLCENPILLQFKNP